MPLLEEIDEFSWKNRTDRSDIIEKSCRYYIIAIPCSECGKHFVLCGAILIRPDFWLEKLEHDTEDLIFRQRQLCEAETKLEASLFTLEEREEELPDAQKPFLKLQMNLSMLTLKELQKALIMSGTADIS